MSFLKDILNSLRAFYEARHEPESIRPLVELYWRMILVFALFALAGILSYGVWEFIGVARTLSAGAGLKSLEQPEILIRADLIDVLEMHRIRQAEFEAAKGSKVTVPDPSR